MIQLAMQAKEKMLNWMMTSKMQLLFSSICLVSFLLAGITFQAFTSAAASSVTADLDPHRSILQARIAFAGASFLFSLASASLYTVRPCMISVRPEKRLHQGGNPEDKKIALEDMAISIGPETSRCDKLTWVGKNRATENWEWEEWAGKIFRWDSPFCKSCRWMRVGLLPFKHSHCSCRPSPWSLGLQTSFASGCSAHSACKSVCRTLVVWVSSLAAWIS